VVFDNRDVGLSTHLDGAASDGSAYTINEMADDVVGLMDHLGFARAHVAGISMGGLISQVVACRHPERVMSMTSVMASTGNPALPGPTPAALEAILEPAPEERAAYIDYDTRGARVFGSPGFPFDEAARRELAARAFDRAFDPRGVARQMAAIQGSGDRRAALAALRVPTLVIHGADDPLVRVEGGRDTAATVPGAELLVLKGMGHDLPRDAWPEIVSALAAHTARAAG
jgi:pimeloyl-ACP methyl ester carboxylesterase